VNVIRLLRHASAVVVVGTPLLGCAERVHRSTLAEPLALVAVDTLVRTGSELLGGVYDLAVSPDGDVYISDYGYKHVVVVGPDGTVRQTIGRGGSGPGEFGIPYVIRAGADTVWVLDAQSNRVQVFDRAGGLVRSYLVRAPGLGSGRDFRNDGWLGATIDGFDSAMVLVLDAAGDPLNRFGEPIVPPVSHYDFIGIKAEIRDGRIPDAFRNRAMLTWAPDHSLYLAFLAEPQVRRYDAAGKLLWMRTLDEPVFRTARETFIRRNVEERNPSRLHSLQYVTDAVVVDGDLWLLLNTADQDMGLLLVLDAKDGTVRHRIMFPGLRKRLYMAPRGEASVLIFDVPDALDAA
jgi:hypothetical protein